MDYNKSDYQILETFKTQNAIDRMSSLTVSQLKQFLPHSKSKIYYSIKAFMLNNLVEYGIKDKNSESFYITNLGLLELQKINILNQHDNN
jgi:hypothetical protein